ncbi:hypothetical protein CHH88_16790 [Bacillus subtilis]|nr:hypothetical protein CHH88_16790 [Bacillus subtilis]
MSATPYVEKVHQENKIYFTKESIRKLVFEVMYMITVERVSRVLNHFKIAFTEQAVLGYLKRGQLDKAALD